MIIQPYNNGDFESFENFENKQIDDEQKSRNIEINDAISAEPFQDESNQSESNQKDIQEEEVVVDAEDSFENVNNDANKEFPFIIEEPMTNTQEVVEPFTGSMENNLLNYHLILKCFLYGMLFYVLNKKQLYDMTEKFSSYLNLEALIFHSIVFVILIYILEQLL